MVTNKASLRAAAVLSAMAALAGCTPHYPQEQTFHDPWKQYELGRIHECNQNGTVDQRLNGANAATPGFGCAHQSNLTLIVADPQDLERPRVMTPADPIVRDRVLQAYRAGENTSAAPDAEGAQALVE